MYCKFCGNNSDFLKTTRKFNCVDHYKNDVKVYRTLGNLEDNEWICCECGSVWFNEYNIKKYRKESNPIE
jgi:hypothetical protein